MKNIAILGPVNTFSDVAYQKYIKNDSTDLEPVYFDTLEEVVRSVSKEIDFAIIPIENTLDGYIPGLLDLILELNLKIVRSFCIPIQFSLVGNVDELKDIKRIYVQYKTKSQCIKFLSKMKDVEIKITESNMQSFELMKDEGEAAIIPSHAYIEKRFGILNVTDALENETRFIVLSKKASERYKSNLLKSTLCITALEDKPGILYLILGVFANKGLNLSSIMSRPTKEKMGKYNFYIDLDIAKEQIDELIKTINEINMKKIVKVINIGIYDA